MSPQPSRSNTRSSDKTVTSRPTHVSRVSSGSRRHPGHDSTSTLVGSAYERKVNELDTVPEKVNSSERLAQLRVLMEKENLQYYVVPSEDAHNSEYVAPTDKRREWISGFTGSAGQAIISRNNAYLVTDSRYWLQARDQVDSNWTIIEAGKPGQPKDWIDFLSSRVKDAKIGIDARMISHEKATLLNSKIHPLGSKLAYPPQNLVDLIWRDKPQRSRASIFLHGLEYAGESANSKIAKVREWIRKQPPDVPSYSRSAPRASQQHVGTLITSLPAIAYLLNLRGSDIPFNPVFQAYLYIALNPSSKHPHTLFVDPVKIKPEIDEYLNSIDVVRRDYTELWAWLRLRQWGDGKVIISPETSYAVSLMLTHMRYTIAPSHVEVLMSVKNETELAGMRRAYIRDGIAFTRFLAWLENKMAQGYEVTEWEAGHRLTEFRRQHKPEWMGLAYENISATGPNAALPHYSPKKGNALVISRETPYLNDSGGQYRDGTCDTTRTMHFGRPTPEMCEAYTKVLQGHIAIDTAIFPEGTSGQQLDVLARRALWKDGWNYMHGTGHGFGQFLTVHEGPHGFSSSIPLVPGHVITNEPGFYNAGQWGMRIESALIVTRVNTRREFNGHIWLGFERLTCVPIQTRMVKESMLTKEEKAWLKDHNQRCYETLAPFLKDDKNTLKWLRREAERGIGLANPAAGLTIDWD
ncbi:Creatinase/aminopeptidase [Schizophyllum commune Tattone D]|nr:Creatinase/aminopeptidase [Schizophyllum commune Tattone D]